MKQSIFKIGVVIVPVVILAGTVAARAESEGLKAADKFVTTTLASTCMTRSNPDFPADMKNDREIEIKYRYSYMTEDEPDNVFMLYKMFCDMGAYNEVDVFLTQDYDGAFQVLSFAEPKADYDYTDDTSTKLKRPPVVSGFTATNTLINADYDESTKTITSAGKWRGLGDAWDSGTWTFMEGQFVLTDYKVDPIYEANLESEADQQALQDESYTLYSAKN